MARWQVVVAIVGILVLVWVGDRYYDVVAFDGTMSGGVNMEHGPTDADMEGDEPADGSPPDSEQQPSGPRDPGENPAGGQQEHDPSQFDHD